MKIISNCSLITREEQCGVSDEERDCVTVMVVDSAADDRSSLRPLSVSHCVTFAALSWTDLISVQHFCELHSQPCGHVSLSCLSLTCKKGCLICIPSRPRRSTRFPGSAFAHTTQKPVASGMFTQYYITT